MEAKTNRSLAVCLATLFVAGIAGAIVAWYSRNATGIVAAVLSGFGAATLALAWFHGRLRQREEGERLDIAEMQQRRPETALFSGNDDIFPARRALIAFERWGIPLAAVVFCAAQAVLSIALWRWVNRALPIRPELSTLSMAFLGGIILVSFLLGRYAAGLTQDRSHRRLRPAASYLLMSAVVFTLSLGSAAVAWFGYPELDQRVARGLIGLLGLLAAESLILLVLEGYRPRQRKGDTHPLYESRILGLLGQPGGLITTVAQALDYQFGFKVSETWFYRWLERALASLVLLQVVVVWLASAVVIVDPHEQATIERFGRRLVGRGILGPGLHFKWPWPAEVARVFSTRENRSLNVGFVPDPQREAERTLVWTRPHYLEELNLLVASRESVDRTPTNATTLEASVPVNLLTASIPVQYHITNVLDWGYQHSDPAQLLERLATREVAHYLVSVDMDAIMSTARLDAARDLHEAIQRSANEHRLGVEILFVGLQDIHPPVSVASAYEAVIGAIQERETKVHEARMYRSQRVPLAEAEATQRVREAESQRSLQLAQAWGTARMFDHQLAAFTASPAVYARRSYLETLVQGTASARKYVLTTTNLSEDYWINLEDKLRPDLLDVTLPAARGETPKP